MSLADDFIVGIVGTTALVAGLAALGVPGMFMPTSRVGFINACGPYSDDREPSSDGLGAPPISALPGDEAVRIATEALEGVPLATFHFPVPATKYPYRPFRVQAPTSRVTLGRLVRQGDGLDNATIRRVVSHRAEDLKRCYERTPRYTPTVDVSVTVTFFVTSSGAVLGAVGSGGDEKVATCTANVIGRLTFPRSTDGGGVQVFIPLDFSPSPLAMPIDH